MDDLEITRMLRDSVVNFLESHSEAASKQTAPGLPQEVDGNMWAQLAELGWLGLALPESVGGSGLGLREATVLTESFGQFAFESPYVAAVVMPSVLLAMSDHRATVGIASQLIAGESLVTLAWQEVRGQIELSLPATELLEHRYVVGNKTFVPLVQSNSLLLVSARSEGEWVIVAVDAAATGVNWQSSATALGSAAELSLDHVEILGDEPLLRGEQAQRALELSIEAGRTALAAQLAGLARGCLAKTLSHTADRVQFGKPLGTLQSVRHRCADMHMSIRLADASWHKALSLLESRPSGRETVAAVSAAKARCADTALEVARGSVQLHGAMGFTEEGGIGRYLRAAMAGSGWLGSSTAHRRRFLAALGSEI